MKRFSLGCVTCFCLSLWACGSSNPVNAGDSGASDGADRIEGLIDGWDGDDLPDPGQGVDVPPLPDPGTDDGAMDLVAPEVLPPQCEPDPCPEDSACVVGSGGETLCRKTGLVVEEFDDTNTMSPATTAAWGEGILTVNLAGFGGDGSDGAFLADQDMVVDTSMNQGVFQYTEYSIQPGVTVTVVGPNPYVVRVTGDVVVDGWLRADGEPGKHACAIPNGPDKPQGGVSLVGGPGGPGGGQGGDSGAGHGKPGSVGGGPGGGTGSGPGSFPNAAGAGGGSHASAGADGVEKGSSYAGSAGATYGDVALDTLDGGSGGGGGGGRDNSDGSVGNGVLDSWDRPGGSGGGGGGAVAIFAVGSIHLTGMITADGGQGGWGDWSGGGGGGSGGAIRLSALGEVFFGGGWLSARGGREALCTNSNQSQDTISGKGGDGIIRVESAEGLQGYFLNPDPIPSFGEIEGPPDGGDGSDGDFKPDQDVVLDTEGGPWNFHSFLVPEGVTLTAQGSSPLIINCQTNIEINGTVDLDGLAGGIAYSACCDNPYSTASRGKGGLGGPGGHDGGDGGSAGDGEDGKGPGGAPGGPKGAFSSAGGGGFAEGGQNGGTNNCAAGIGPPGGSANGDPELTVLEGGSGGGGAGDAWAAACTWCEDQACIVTSSDLSSCPDPKPSCSYCPNVMGACAGVTGCHPTAKWNPGSGGGGGGGALALVTPGMVMLNGTIRMDGGDGGDNKGSSSFNDGTCAPECDGGCAAGVCNPPGGGSFGGSGGGGSGGGLLIRASGVRATGWVSAVGGWTGKLTQGGGCTVNPDAHDPLPGQGRGGRGSPGRIRVETTVALGAVAVGDGFFTTSNVIPTAGTFAQSLWYPLDGNGSRVAESLVDGAGALDEFQYQTAWEYPEGEVDAGSVGPWESWAPDLSEGAFVRFRVEMDPPQPPQMGSVIESVTLSWVHDSEPPAQ